MLSGELCRTPSTILVDGLPGSSQLQGWHGADVPPWEAVNEGIGECAAIRSSQAAGSLQDDRGGRGPLADPPSIHGTWMSADPEV
jgi:hypothetical protein